MSRIILLTFRSQSLTNCFFLLWLFYLLKAEYQAISAYYRKAGQACRMNKKGDIFENLCQLEYESFWSEKITKEIQIGYCMWVAHTIRA